MVCQPTEPRTPAASAASQTLELLGNAGFSCLAFPGRQRDGCEEATFLETSRPDVLLHFGDDPISTKLIEEAKARDIPVIFWLEDLSCTDRTVLRPADYVVVPSKSARRHYWETLGLACVALPKGEGAADAYREFFSNIFPQPGVPYMPARIASLSY